MVERKIKNMNLYVFERDGKPTDDFIQEVNEWVNLHKELQVIDYILGKLCPHSKSLRLSLSSTSPMSLIEVFVPLNSFFI